MEVAVATRTHPREWAATDPGLLATTVAVLEEQAKRRR